MEINHYSMFSPLEMYTLGIRGMCFLMIWKLKKYGKNARFACSIIVEKLMMLRS
jgi:hypothetical protein